jgi:hypothetical protein
MNDQGNLANTHRLAGDVNGWLICACGHREATVWGMSVHRKEASNDSARAPPGQLSHTEKEP